MIIMIIVIIIITWLQVPCGYPVEHNREQKKKKIISQCAMCANHSPQLVPESVKAVYLHSPAAPNT